MNEDMVEAGFDWISEMRAGNLRFIIEVPNISLLGYFALKNL